MGKGLLGFAIGVVFMLPFAAGVLTVNAADSAVNVGIFIVNPAKTQHEASDPGVISLDLMRQISQRMNWFVVLKGKTSPYAQVYVLQNGVRVGMVQADVEGGFEAGIHNPKSGIYEWAVYVRDQLGIESAKVTFTGEAREGTTIVFEPIIPPPTMYGIMGITGTVYHIGGAAIPGHRVMIEMKDESGSVYQQESDGIAGPDGRWIQNMIVSSLPKGTIVLYSSIDVNGERSVFSLPVKIDVQRNDTTNNDVSAPYSTPFSQRELTRAPIIQNRVNTSSQSSSFDSAPEYDNVYKGDARVIAQNENSKGAIGTNIMQNIFFFIRTVIMTIVEYVIRLVKGAK